MEFVVGDLVVGEAVVTGVGGGETRASSTTTKGRINTFLIQTVMHMCSTQFN